MRPVSLPLLLALALAAPAMAAPASALAASAFYDNAALLLPKIQRSRKTTYRRSVEASLARGKIKSVSLREDGETKRLATRSEGHDKLKRIPLAGIAALAYTSAARFRGGERDLLVRLDNGDVVAVTLWHSPRGDVTVQVGRTLAGPPAFGGDISDDRADIARRFGTGRVRGGSGRWKSRELRVLSGALAKLSRKERKTLRDVDIVRSRAGPRGPNNAAHYIWGTAGYKLVVYDRAFKFDRRTFIGRSARPHPFSSMSIVHEVGHAIAAWPARRVLEQGDVRRAARIARRGPVLDAYARVKGNRSGPTRYGRTTLAESFAEAFALHKLDPAGLKRWDGDVADWFARDRHLAAME